jgi:ABC-2 type transport system ATP-binding protein
MTLPAISVRNIAKSFGSVRAVDNLSFDVATGEVLGFLGPNGAGKSTTMKMITGFLTPDRGSITVSGYSVRDARLPAQRTMGYLPEGAPLYGDMTVWNFLGFIARMRGLDRAAARTAIAAQVEALALVDVLDRPVEALSKGFKRRVGLAQALLHNPPVLILDEPTDGLDPNQKHQIRTLIRTLAATRAILVSTHILEEVETICTRTVIISKGRLVYDATPAAMRAAAGPDGRLDDVFRKLTVGETPA